MRGRLPLLLLRFLVNVIMGSCFKESWKAVAPWPHTADMDLPTSLPTTWLKVVDHPVPGMLCTLCKSTPRYHAVEKLCGHQNHAHYFAYSPFVMGGCG